MNRLVIRRQLEQLGCTVSEACDGQEAVDRLSGARLDVDLVLMDCQMPRLSGADATRQIRTHHDASALPIVALTATAVATERDTCIAAGMNDFLTKPLRPERLSALLAHIREGR
jgi:CheY-like chemotaxis protein